MSGDLAHRGFAGPAWRDDIGGVAGYRTAGQSAPCRNLRYGRGGMAPVRARLARRVLRGASIGWITSCQAAFLRIRWSRLALCARRKAGPRDRDGCSGFTFRGEVSARPLYMWQAGSSPTGEDEKNPTFARPNATLHKWRVCVGQVIVMRSDWQAMPSFDSNSWGGPGSASSLGARDHAIARRPARYMWLILFLVRLLSPARRQPCYPTQMSPVDCALCRSETPRAPVCDPNPCRNPSGEVRPLLVEIGTAPMRPSTHPARPPIATLPFDASTGRSPRPAFQPEKRIR